MSASGTSPAPDEKSIQFLLDQLADYQSHRDILALEKQALIDSVITPEIKAKLAEIDAEFADKFAAADKNATTLGSEIKTAVLAYGSSVKGSRLHAIWSKARASWDLKKFDEYALANPEILSLREMGKPSVSIKPVK